MWSEYFKDDFGLWIKKKILKTLSNVHIALKSIDMDVRKEKGCYYCSMRLSLQNSILKMCHFKINKDHQSDLGRQSGLVVLAYTSVFTSYVFSLVLLLLVSVLQPTCTDVMVLKSISMHIRSLSFYSLKLSKTVETTGCHTLSTCT